MGYNVQGTAAKIGDTWFSKPCIAFSIPQDFSFLTVSGVAMGTSWILLYEAYSQIGVSIASLCYYCGSVIVIILSPLLFKENLTLDKIIGFITVLIGIFLINGQGTVSANHWGLIYGLSSAAMYDLQ